ncbi:hypothetical protein NWT39_01765 [Nitrososphaera viennensis]|uniref:Uncharacterized protein n=1 Tax=Nitrososphaera viennensis TaxID=1034015 RepID=A0A977IEX6_9ARCH|nr:hypothetical protein [Nitrososphaera viennensis]UVS69525.1 hypothetical protein NWT39_01765 [Nitrososphaera viennensis]
MYIIASKSVSLEKAQAVGTEELAISKILENWSCHYSLALPFMMSWLLSSSMPSLPYDSRIKQLRNDLKASRKRAVIVGQVNGVADGAVDSLTLERRSVNDCCYCYSSPCGHPNGTMRACHAIVLLDLRNLPN